MAAGAAPVAAAARLVAAAIARGLRVAAPMSAAAVSAAMSAAPALGQSGHRRRHRRGAGKKNELTHDTAPVEVSREEPAATRERSMLIDGPCAT